MSHHVDHKDNEQSVRGGFFEVTGWQAHMSRMKRTLWAYRVHHRLLLSGLHCPNKDCLLLLKQGAMGNKGHQGQHKCKEEGFKN